MKNIRQKLSNLKRSAFGSIAMLLMFAPAAQAANCETGAKVASDLWREYDQIAKQVGCAGVAVGTAVASGGDLPTSVKVYQKCFENANDYDETARGLIKKWNNNLVGNKWPHIGPRSLGIGNSYKGTIRGPGTRMFISEAPVNSRLLQISIQKRDEPRNRGATEVTVCKFTPEGQGEKIWNFTIGNGHGNRGKTWTRTFSGVRGHFMTVSFKGQSAVKATKYRLSTDVKANRTVVIDSGNDPGATNYTINASGNIQQVGGNLEGHRVTRNSNDRVSGNSARGKVANGADGFHVMGEINNISLDDPDAATVYVNGEKYVVPRTVVIDSSNDPGATNYSINASGNIEQVDGTLAGHRVSINPNRDRVSGNNARGRVSSGADGFQFMGEIPEINLDNPDAATVYVDGKEYHTVVIDSGNDPGATGYSISTSGNIEQVDGTLAGHRVTIQNNDNVSGNSARGRVNNAADGFRVMGEINDINLDNPNAATVYVDGERYAP